MINTMKGKQSRKKRERESWRCGDFNTLVSKVRKGHLSKHLKEVRE